MAKAADPRLLLRGHSAPHGTWGKLQMDLAVAGLVTAEGVIRLWTREGSCDVTVSRPDELRDLLGSGRVDREPLLDHGAKTDMVLLDVPGSRLIVSAPFQPPDESVQPLCAPFALGSWKGPLAWTGETADCLATWVGEALQQALDRGESFLLQERDINGQGERQFVAFFIHDGEEWCADLRTNAPPGPGSFWEQASHEGLWSLIRFGLGDTGTDTQTVAQLAMITIMAWPGGPLDIVAAWTALEAPTAPASTPPVLEATARRRDRGSQIEAVHMPWRGAEPLSVVIVDRRDARRWYSYVEGGPVEGVRIGFDDLPGHQVYVNSRYSAMEPGQVNDRATALLQYCGVGMYLDEIRGDVLVVGDQDRSGYPTAVDEGLVYVLCGDD